MPSWAHLYLECRKEGIGHEATLIRISTAIDDAYCSEIAYFIKYELREMSEILNANTN